MKYYIDGIDFYELQAMKYYAPPASWSTEKRKETTTNRIFSGEWYGSVKHDGYFQKILKDEDGNIFMLSRSKSKDGTYPDKHEWIPHLNEFFDSLPNGTCLLCECYFPNNEGSKKVTSVLGCLKDKAIDRQSKGDKLHLYVFDVLAFNGKSLIDTPALERFGYIKNKIENIYSSYVETAEYVCGSELWDLLQTTLSSGGEGIVITHEGCKYQPGKRPSKETLKCKQELLDTIDCFIIGANPPTRLYTGKCLESWPYWYDIKNDKLIYSEPINDGYVVYTNAYKDYKNGLSVEPITKNYYLGMAGSLKLGLMKDGKAIYFGDLSGLSDDILSNWKEYIGKVCEVGGMSLDDETRHIRHPRFLGWRTDKLKEDCLWSQVE